MAADKRGLTCRSLAGKVILVVIAVIVFPSTLCVTDARVIIITWVAVSPRSVGRRESTIPSRTRPVTTCTGLGCRLVQTEPVIANFK